MLVLLLLLPGQTRLGSSARRCVGAKSQHAAKRREAQEGKTAVRTPPGWKVLETTILLYLYGIKFIETTNTFAQGACRHTRMKKANRSSLFLSWHDWRRDCNPCCEICCSAAATSAATRTGASP
ncbi:MAG: hypothetical protein ACRYGK_03960 [Janthinobacterium lividum]